MEKPNDDHPKSFTLLIGPPRSGTTLIANTFMSHPEVSGVIEPFQRSRKETAVSPDLDNFLKKNLGDTGALQRRPNLAVKETTTRIQNVEMSFELIESAAAQSIYTGLVIILRCPFQSFLSQVEASTKLWNEKKLTAATTETFNNWIAGQARSLRLLTDRARAHHYRLISYEAFCNSPKAETARLMALVPLRLHPDQLQYSAPKSVQSGGDPKTKQKAGKIEVTDRSAVVEAFIQELGSGPGKAFANALRDIVRDKVCLEPDNTTLDRISRLCMLGS